MKTKKRFDFPEQIRLENTNKCNAHCVICPREKQTRAQGFMDESLLERILEECRGERITKFTVQGYGEPLLDKNFCRFVRRAKDTLDCPTFSVSNGSLITPGLAREMVSSGLDKVKISFYGVNKEEYEKIHTPLSFDKTRQCILNLIEAKKEAGSSMKIRLQYIGSIWRFLPFCLQWAGKTMVGFNTLHNYGHGRRYNRRENRGRCPMLDDPILQVLWNGDIVPCCYDFNGEMVLGNLYKNSIREIWRGEPYEKMRKANDRGDFSDYPICLMCDRRR